MKKYIRGLVIGALCLLPISVHANDIYIEQVGDTLDLDITQDGQDNVIGTSTTDVNLAGDTMTFAITQTGDFNTIAADIQGNTYTGTWTFTGDSNAVDLSCDSTSGVNCENITLNITTTGDSNTYDFNVGDVADADGSTISFTVTGDDNVIENRQLETGLSNWEFTEIISGLDLDDRIVLSVDRAGVKDGATVEIEKSDEEKESENPPSVTEE